MCFKYDGLPFIPNSSAKEHVSFSRWMKAARSHGLVNILVLLFPDTSSTCPSGWFSCDNGECIPEHWRCDGDDDCTDSSDEIRDCQHQCPADKFQCDGNRCIPRSWLCDQQYECRDHTDERNCSKCWTPVKPGAVGAGKKTCLLFSELLCSINSWKSLTRPDCLDSYHRRLHDSLIWIQLVSRWSRIWSHFRQSAYNLGIKFLLI